MAKIRGIFDAVTYNSPKVSTFDGSHDIKTSCKIGDAFVLDCVPVYPRDNFRFRYGTQAKFSPLVAPAFQKMALKQWSFFVRNSDVWDDFNTFVTGVDPKTGRTAYNSDAEQPIHPHFRLNSAVQHGSSYLGTKLNLTDIDLSAIKVTSQGVTVTKDELLKHLLALKLSPSTCYSVNYEDGSKMRSLWAPYFSKDSKTPEYLYSRVFALRTFVEQTENLFQKGAMISFFADNAPDLEPTDDYSNLSGTVRLSDFYTTFNRRGFKPLASPGTNFDYLGYPVTDFRSYFNSQSFVNDVLNNKDSFTSVSSLGQDFFNRYIYGLTNQSGTPSFVDGFTNIEDFDTVENDHNFILDFYGYEISTYTFDELGHFSKSGDNLVINNTLLPPHFTRINNSYTEQTTDLLSIVMRYLVWAKLTNNNTTMIDSAPYFDVCLISNFVQYSEQKVDSLRLRCYHKIWNDYFRDVNLTAEIPIPYADSGHDLLNYYNAVDNFLDANYTNGKLLDWNRTNLFDSDKFKPFEEFYIDAEIYDEQSDLRHYVDTLVMWDLLTEPFKHLRNRDYLTGALPNSSVVDIVAPIQSTESLQGYQTDPYTNKNMSLDSSNSPVHDNTDIDPTKAQNLVGGPQSVSPIGWLDIENLRITQKLKQFFVNLRHAMNGIKDFTKVFWDVDIDDLTLHRAEYLGGNMQFVSISELLGSAETSEAALGALGGRANSFGQSGEIQKFVKDYGFIITLECLSPIQTNVGGLTRQLIREDRFDYFLPTFSELGDMKINKIEVSAMPTLLGLEPTYDDTFGYTQRYMDLKYIEDKVHSDFLGAKSDWHLDLMQKPFNVNDVELSQAWLEEREDDRIFTDTYENENNCFIWTEVDCSYQRALPSIVREVINA